MDEPTDKREVDLYELYGPMGKEITNARRMVLARTVTEIKRAYAEGREWDAYVYFTSITDLYEILWLQLQLASDERAAIKRFQQSEREYDERLNRINLSEQCNKPESK